jgi:hypothetical protein
VVVTTGEWLTRWAGDEAIDGGGVDGRLGSGVGEYTGREEAAAGPCVAEEGTEATPLVGGMGVKPATGVEMVKCDCSEANTGVRGADADDREAAEEVVCTGGEEGALQGGRMESTTQGDAGLTAGEVTAMQRAPKRGDGWDVKGAT